jgi:flagellar hook-length control protein FliK
MISLTTFDEIQGSVTPNMGQESAITSVSRLASVASFDRSTVTSISGSNADSESNFSQLMSGNPLAMMPADARSNSASPTAKASALFKALPLELEKFKQSGQSQIQLDLPVSDSESVRIRLNIRAGEIRSTFITESPELRDALQKAWPEFSATHRTQNLQFGESNFQDGLARQNNTPFDQGNRRQYQPDSDIADSANKPTSLSVKQPSTVQQTPANTIRQGKVNLWA